MRGTDILDLGDAVQSDTQCTEVLCSGSDKCEFGCKINRHLVCEWRVMLKQHYL